MSEGEYLFDPAMLADLEKEKIDITLPEGKTIHKIDGLTIRPLKRDDFNRGLAPLLKQLTSIGDLDKEKFEKRFDEWKAVPDTYYIIAFEDNATGKLVAMGTVVVEKKLIHGAAKRGHIEDIVVDSEQRGKYLGKIIIEQLKIVCRRAGAYKVTLDCKTDRVGFYEKCGFNGEGMAFMQHRY
eukprot:Clim_evm40s55 gene=Clim_evmTU40s55